MIYKVKYSDEAMDDIASLRRSQPQAFNKLRILVKELEEHPKTGSGRPKRLKGNLAVQWSRRIDKKNRLVYTIDDDVVVVLVLSAWGHYDDK